MFDFLKNGALVAVIAQGPIGISLVWDKVLLKKPGTQNLYSYVFWLGAMSVFGVVLVPFGYNSPTWTVVWIAFVAGVVHLLGVFFYYAALKRGEASETLAIMGGFSPVATAAIGFALLTKQMSGTQLLGFALMTAGGFVMFFSEHLPLRKLLPPVLLASGLLGLVNVLEKVVYNQTNFVTGYVWFTIGTFVAALVLLVRPSWRKQIFAESGNDEPRNRFWYFVNRFISGVGSFLIFFAISLTHPAVVDAIAGVRYAVIFLGALLLTKLRPKWLKESFHGWQFATKASATGLVVAGLVVVGLNGGSKSNGGSPTAMLPPNRLCRASVAEWDCWATTNRTSRQTNLDCGTSDPPASREPPPQTPCRHCCGDRALDLGCPRLRLAGFDRQDLHPATFGSFTYRKYRDSIHSGSGAHD